MEHKVLETASRNGGALTFEDVRLQPRYSEIAPGDPDTSGRFSANIVLSLPLASSAMDTVTEERMACAMAINGGIGIIHMNMSPETQTGMVRKVKRSGYVVINPVSVNPRDRLEDVHARAGELGFDSFPVVKGGKVVGMVTRQPLEIGRVRGKRFIEDIMKEPVYVEFGTSKEKALDIMEARGVGKLLVIKEGALYGITTLSDILKEYNNSHATRDGQGRLKVGAAVGTLPADSERVEGLVGAGVDVLVVDSSHGYCKDIIETIKDIKKEYEVNVVAGNVVTGEGAAGLAEAGADGVKVGIGPGSICTTREVTGVGVPQVSAVYESYKGLEKGGYEVPVIADGGIKNSGDVVIALAVGASAVMVGNMLAGTDEAPGDEMLYEGRKYKVYRGMASRAVLGTRPGYGKAPEGVEGLVPYSGTVEEVMKEIEGGVRSGMAHLNARDIYRLREAEIRRVTPAGSGEGGPNLAVVLDRRPGGNAKPF